MMSEDSTYFQKWYEENGSKLNKARRQKYANDPDYQKKVRERNAGVRQRRRDAKVQEQISDHQERRAKVAKHQYRVVTNESGEQLFSIGAVAEFLGCSVQVIRLWESRGVIPRVSKEKREIRLYSKEQIFHIQRVVEEKGLLQRGVPKGFSSLDDITSLHVVRTVVLADGTSKECRLYRVGVMAEALCRTASTLEQMERRGMFPKTPFRAAKTRYRLYTADMILAAKRSFDARGGAVRGPGWKEVCDEIKAEWERLGVSGRAKLVAK